MARDGTVQHSPLGGPVVAIMFTDVVRSTESYEASGDVTTRTSIAVHDELVRAAVEAHHGRVVKMLGDGALAVFTSPRAAMAAAAEFQTGMAERRATSSDRVPDVRIGLHIGEVLEDDDGDVHGLAVSVASRVMAEATGGTVLLTDLVARLAGTVPGLETAALGHRPLRGLTDPVVLHELRWEHATSLAADDVSRPGADARADRAAMFGRAFEMAELERWMAEARNGSGRLVLIQGEPGIGKTRLAEEFAARESAAGTIVAWGRCVEDAGAPALWPWRQVLDTLGIVVADLVDVGAAEAERRFLLFEHVLAQLRALGRDHGVLVVFDDLHWADHATLLLLTHVMRGVPAPPVLMIGTFRATEPGALAPVIADLSRTRGAQRIELRGLSKADVLLHLEAISRTAVSDAVGRDITAATAGNPFFVGEVGRTLRDGTWTGVVPATVRDVTRQRIERLSEGCAAFLRSASVLGQEFATATAAAVCDVDIETAMALIDEATAAGLVEPGSVEGEHRYAHALVRDTLETDLPSPARVGLHVKAARAIEMLRAADLDRHLPDLARHWAAAAPGGHTAEAALWAERAGDAASRSLAYEEAARLYRSALDTGGMSMTQSDRSRLHLALARVLFVAGELSASLDSCIAAADLARAADRADLLAEAALVLESVGDPGVNARVYDLCVESIDRLGEGGSTALRARLLAQLSHLVFYRFEHDRVGQLSADALDLARRSGDDVALVAALRARQEAMSGPGGLHELAALADEMIAAGARLGSPSVSMWGHLWRFDALAAAERLVEAEDQLERVEEQVSRVGGPISKWHLARCRTLNAQARGRIAEAHAFSLEAFEVMRKIEPDTAARGHRAALSILGRHARLTDDQVDLFVPDEPPPFLFANVAGAAGLLRAGRVDDAKAKLARLGPPAAWRIPPFLRVPLHTVALLVAVELDQRADAAFSYEVVSAHRGQSAVAGAGAFVHPGPIELYLGIGAAYLGRLDEAISDLEHAAERSEAAGLAGFAIEARCELAHVLVRRGKPGDAASAAELAGTAREAASALGMDRLADRAAEAIEAASRAQSPLSAREEEVAKLVAEGKTNREIADALVISERTAQNHVQHILTKLGFSRRSEIAAWVVRRE